jgi:hypothetical protein
MAPEMLVSETVELGTIRASLRITRMPRHQLVMIYDLTKRSTTHKNKTLGRHMHYYDRPTASASLGIAGFATCAELS